MTNISLDLIKTLREETGAGMLDVKNALEESSGDKEKAIDILRKKGLSARAKKASRTASEGIVDSYIHAGGKVGVLLEVNCETDFVARTDDFKELVHDIALQIAASAPLYVNIEDVPVDVVEKEKEIVVSQAKTEGKPENIIEKVAEGRIKKFYEEVVLMEQPFFKEPEKTMGVHLGEYVGKLGENIKISKFVRFVLGQ